MAMAKLGFIRRVTTSFLLFYLSQSSLFMLPHLLPSLPLLAMLPISGVVMAASMALGKCWKKVLGVSASAPAFVIFNLLFLCGVYVLAIRQVVPLFFDVVINAECTLLVVAFYRIHNGDPGVVRYDSSSLSHEESRNSEVKFQHENTPLYSRVRYCKICKRNVWGFDHHCSAFGNCIGQKNHRLFIFLLLGFILVESSYTFSASKYITKLNAEKIQLESTFLGKLVISTALFSVLQLLWQVPFLIWHIYCISANIKSDEWINWKKYPEFQVVIPPHPGSSFSEMKFSNPYDKGIIANIRDFIKADEQGPV